MKKTLVFLSFFVAFTGYSQKFPKDIIKELRDSIDMLKRARIYQKPGTDSVFSIVTNNGDTSWAYRISVTSKTSQLTNNSGFTTGSAVAATYLKQTDAATTYQAKEAGKGLSANDYTATEKTKLAGIADGATANSSDATLLSRANHTGTQAVSTVSGLQTALDGKAAATHPHAAGDVTSGTFADARIPQSSVTQHQQALSLTTSQLSGVLPFSQGGIGGATATTATTGAMTVPMTSEIITITPTGAATFNATGGVAGQRITFVVTTSGTTSFTLTFGTNFRAASTLATGTTTAKKFAINFLFDGSTWIETGRTAAL